MKKNISITIGTAYTELCDGDTGAYQRIMPNAIMIEIEYTDGTRAVRHLHDLSDEELFALRGYRKANLVS